MANRLEYFIAQRTAKGGASNSNSQAEGGVMLRVATIAIALSIAVMILSLAVILGFKREVHTQLTSLSGDIIISSTRGVSPSHLYPITKSPAVESLIESAAEEYGSNVTHISTYAARSAVVTTPQGVEGVVLKGLDAHSATDIFQQGIVEGEVPRFDGDKSSRNTILSSELARELEINIGDRLDIMVTNDDSSIRRDVYRVGAIYSTTGGETEKRLIITDIRNIQRLNGWDDEEISGYEVSISHPKRGNDIAEHFNYQVIFNSNSEANGIAAFSAQRLFPAIFDWLAALDINAVVVITIMMIVAIFNIITALLILVLERIQMVGILKSLGMNNKSVRKIFLYRALDITIRGVVWGNAIAIILALLQQHFKIIKLDQSGYMLNCVPIDLGIWWIAALNIGVIATIIVTVIIPTRLASSIEPHKAIKFQ